MMLRYSGEKLYLNSQTLRNEEMHQVYQIILKVIVQYLLPHYLLMMMLNYVYKPRLAHMIHAYTQDKLEIIQIKKAFNIVKFFNESKMPGTNGYHYSCLNYQAYNNLTERQIKQLAQYKFMKVQSIDFGAMLTKLTTNLSKIQEYLEDHDFFVVPKFVDSIYTLVPCRSKVYSD